MNFTVFTENEICAKFGRLLKRKDTTISDVNNFFRVYADLTVSSTNDIKELLYNNGYSHCFRQHIVVCPFRDRYLYSFRKEIINNEKTN